MVSGRTRSAKAAKENCGRAVREVRLDSWNIIAEELSQRAIHCMEMRRGDEGRSLSVTHDS